MHFPKSCLPSFLGRRPGGPPRGWVYCAGEEGGGPRGATSQNAPAVTPMRGGDLRPVWGDPYRHRSRVPTAGHPFAVTAQPRVVATSRALGKRRLTRATPANGATRTGVLVRRV